MEITGLPDARDYDFEEDDALKDAVWNGRKVKIIENYRYSPQMQRFRLAPNLIQDCSICMAKSSLGMEGKVTKEPGRKAEGEFSMMYENTSEDGKSKVELEGTLKSTGEAEGKVKLKREF